MTRGNHRPRRGEKVWIEGEPQPNGVITYIDWFDGEPLEVTVKFYDTKARKEFPFAEFEGNWSESFGGTWMLPKLEIGT